MKNIVIFASGSGSNAEEIVKYFAEHPTICIKTIISNKQDAYVHERAKMLGIPSKIFTNKDFAECDTILDYLDEVGTDYIVLAGFLLKIASKMIQKYPNRIINIHPALLPKYGGKGMYGDNVHKAVLEAREKESGITIHFVNEEYDKGAVIFQAKTSIDPTDKLEDVAAKIHILEHRHFARVIEKTING